ncbi:hypothetical protein [Beijerinckia sp. L45]|uniref:hypothetical protein n=1 Tax=Beijerinckia sp. L45 TaxID=1641855 RepID=UPI00131AEAB5|nr:hypothetical protein [Beijerinckia sp. L45]
MSAAGAPRRDHWLARLALAIGGGYLFASGAAACLGLLLSGLGITRPQAAMTATMAGIAIYLAAAISAFANRSLGFLAAVLIGGGAVLAVIALSLRAMH